MMNKAERFAVLSATSDLTAMRLVIADDIHRGTPESLRRALESVNLLGQIVHELRQTAKAEPIVTTDVLTPSPEIAEQVMLRLATVDPKVTDLKDAIVRGQSRAYARYTLTTPDDYEKGWRRGYDGGWLDGLKRAAELLRIDVTDVVRPHPMSPEAQNTCEETV